MIPSKVVYRFYSERGTYFGEREHSIDCENEFKRVMQTVAEEPNKYEIIGFGYPWQEKQKIYEKQDYTSRKESDDHDRKRIK